MNPLEHIDNKVENMSAELWDKRYRVGSATAVGPLLQKTAWINQQTRTHLSVSRVYRVYNKESDAAYHLTHLPVSSFLRHFKSYFLQPNTWWLRLFPYDANHHLCTMHNTKKLPQGSPIPPPGKTTQHVGIGKPTEPGCASLATSKEWRIQSLSFKYLIDASTPDYKWPMYCMFQKLSVEKCLLSVGKIFVAVVTKDPI